jgi:hypothetical protein
MMTNVKDNGGPAFPCEWDYIGSNREAANGMTLRDYFAAKAMQASIVGQGIPDFSGSRAGIAEAAYKMADAMLAERSKQ